MGSIILKGKSGSYSFDPFDPASKIGEGATGRIFKGQDLGTGHAVAIKVLYKHLTQDPANIKRLQLESTIRISHNNLVKMLDFVHDPQQDIYHSVSEFIEGFTLSDRLAFFRDNGEQISVEEVKHIGMSVANALEILHSHDPRIIHRDVDPSNIMLCPDGTVKLMDLGIAKILQTGPQQVRLTKLGSIIGKQHYISPEQINNSSGDELAPASDLYSLGITLFESLTGKVPFDGSSEFEIYQKHQKARLPKNKLLTKPLYSFLVNATAKKQMHRYQTAKEFKDDLSKIKPDGSAESKIKLLHDNSRKWKYSAAAVVFVAIGFTGLAMFHQLQKTRAIAASCGDLTRDKILSPAVLPDSMAKHISAISAPVDSAESETKNWRRWFNDPNSFQERINVSGLRISSAALVRNRNRLLMKLLFELKDASLGDRAHRVDIINVIPWDSTAIIEKALNGELRVNMLIQLSDLESRSKTQLRRYMEGIENKLAASQNYLVLYKSFLKADDFTKASRYAFLENKPLQAQEAAIESMKTNKGFENEVLLANSLAGQNHYREAYDRYIKALQLYSADGEDRPALLNAVNDLELMVTRKDMKANTNFIRFVMGLLYEKASPQNAVFEERSQARFRCFLASASNSSEMASFRAIARAKLK